MVWFDYVFVLPCISFYSGLVIYVVSKEVLFKLNVMASVAYVDIF